MSAFLTALGEADTREDLLAQIARLTEDRAHTAATHSVRVAELLEANNREVERRRDAESRFKALEAANLWTLADLQAANIVRDAEWRPEDKPPLDLSFRGNELAGEVGEACNFIKKLERERLGWPGSRATTAQLAEELADTVICASLAAMTAGIDLMSAVAAKFNATSEKMGLTTRLPDEPAQRDGRGPYPAEPNALRNSIAELDAWLDSSDALDEIENQQSFGESIMLVVHELKRLQALAAPLEAQAFQPTHRHLKRGSEYRVIGEAEAQVSTGDYRPDWTIERRIADGDRLTVYQGADGKLWVRFTDEFNDGRFVAIEAEA